MHTLIGLLVVTALLGGGLSITMISVLNFDNAPLEMLRMVTAFAITLPMEYVVFTSYVELKGKTATPAHFGDLLFSRSSFTRFYARLALATLFGNRFGLSQASNLIWQKWWTTKRDHVQWSDLHGRFIETEFLGPNPPREE